MMMYILIESSQMKLFIPNFKQVSLDKCSCFLHVSGLFSFTSLSQLEVLHNFSIIIF